MRLIFTPRRFIILAGLIFGVLAALMTDWGNPANMGICVACFLRDIAGGLGLHRAGVVQYLRPEIMGFVLGAFVSAFAFREFRSRGGSAPMLRFFLGAFVMIGALVFLGCPVRALLRLAGGDLNGITALAGVVAGAAIGIFLLRKGFNLGRSGKMNAAAGWIMPVAMFGILLLVIIEPGIIFFSDEGPGSLHVPIATALVVGLTVGVLAQRTRMCFVGGWRDLIMVKDTYLFGGIAAFLVGALIANAALGFIDWGFVGQPVAHDDHLWNFFGMLLVGLAATLLGGCPLRQLILSGEGDTDAGVTVLGLLAGAAFAHNFLAASSPNGTGTWGPAAVGIGLAFCLAVGFLMREKAK
ncbi:MAG: YedE-related selenium metabolism membrane protein [Dehalococcoidia bacterium]|nr:YedE-related selenium metabolism membrane protein [Dehalococcoidia bacterium]